jgi:hypothetical protein
MPVTLDTPKQAAAELLRRLPDDSTLEDIQYHLYVLEKIRKGRVDIAQGRGFSQDRAKDRLSKWLAE